MATTFKLVHPNKINQKQRNLIYGYMRECQLLFPSDNVYYNIPELINQICLTFYYIQLRFYTQTRGSNLNFPDNDINDGQTVEKLKGDGKWSVCIFGDDNDKICGDEYDEFNLWFKWTKSYVMSFGFITSTINESISTWSDYLGSNANKEHSVGIYVAFKDKFVILDHPKSDDNGKQIKIENNMKQGDIWGIFINFKLDKFTISHNDINCGTYSLFGAKTIIPAFAFFDCKQQIDVIKYEFKRK